MNHNRGYGILAALLALAVAALACIGGNPTPTSAPTAAAPTQGAQTQAVATEAPTEAATASGAPTQGSAAASTGQATVATTAAAAATRAPLSGNLDVHGVSGYLDSEGYYHVVGLVTNRTDKPVKNIELSVQLSDSSGKTVLQDNSGNPTSTVTIDPLLTIVDTGESSPFGYDLSTNATDTSGWQSKVQVTKSEAASDLHRAQTKVENDQVSVGSNGTVYLTGELVNLSNKPAQVQGFAGAMLDGPDKVAGAASFSSITRLLAPAGDKNGSDRTPFALNIGGPLAKSATPMYYVDVVEGNSVDMQAAADVHLDLGNYFVDGDNGVHVLATITNSGTHTLTVQLVAGLYDQAGKVLDASSVNAPLDVGPGGSSPVPFYSFSNLNGNADLIGKAVSYTVQVDPFWTFPTTSELVSLQATNVTKAATGSGVTLKGEIVNTTNKKLDLPTVVAAVRDPSGKLVASDWTGANGNAPIQPKAKLTFDLTMQLPPKADPGTLKYDIIVQAQVSSQ